MYKISGTGFLCKNIKGEWAVLFKLTPEQLKIVRDSNASEYDK